MMQTYQSHIETTSMKPELCLGSWDSRGFYAINPVDPAPLGELKC